MKLHFHPTANWMNDPNGLVQLDGWYHLFYQYNPHGLAWGDIHWGHARSRDLYAWEQLPIAMTPDAARREQHCFSGSCCKDAEGKPHFFYTSIGYEEDGRSHHDGAQQWTAEPADAELTRLVQTDEHALTVDLHAGPKPLEWRDPCVVPYKGGYLMVLGGSMEGRGCVLLYTSDDMKHWTYRHILAQSDVADDVPWECPNLCFVDGKTVIFYSPCAEVAYLLGELDDALCFHEEKRGLLDPGARDGFYAPQVLRDDQGRSIVFGWMPECDGDEDVKRRGWNGCMSVPRLLRVVQGDLAAELLDGWQAYCGAPVQVDIPCGENVSVEAGCRYVLQTVLKAGQRLCLNLLCAQESSAQPEHTGLCIAADDTQVSAQLDRTHSSTLTGASVRPMSLQAPLLQGEASVTLIVEDNTVELCVNGRWLSARVYPQQGGRTLCMTCDGGAAPIRLYTL